MLRTLSCLVAALIVVSVVHTPLAAGVDAILVGETLLRSGNVAGKLAEFKSAT